jgi:hypothetical protein
VERVDQLAVGVVDGGLELAPEPLGQRRGAAGGGDGDAQVAAADGRGRSEHAVGDVVERGEQHAPLDRRLPQRRDLLGGIVGVLTRVDGEERPVEVVGAGGAHGEDDPSGLRHAGQPLGRGGGHHGHERARGEQPLGALERDRATTDDEGTAAGEVEVHGVVEGQHVLLRSAVGAGGGRGQGGWAGRGQGGWAARWAGLGAGAGGPEGDDRADRAGAHGGRSRDHEMHSPCPRITSKLDELPRST